MGFLPGCGHDDGWDCGRSVIFSAVSIITTIWCAYALLRMYPAVRRTGWFKMESTMIALCLVQEFTSSLYFTFSDDERWLFTVKYLRGLQNVLTFFNYGRLAIQILQHKYLKYGVYGTVGGSVVLLTAIFIYACSTPSLDCGHPSWILLSALVVVLASLFAGVGLKVLREISNHAKLTHSVHTFGGVLDGMEDMPSTSSRDVAGAGDAFFTQKRTQAGTLVLVNTLGALFQLTLDLTLRKLHDHSGECAAIHDDGLLVQLSLVLLRLLSYAAPVWATVYVFFIVPRKQYDTDGDVRFDLDDHRGFDLLDDEDDDEGL